MKKIAQLIIGLSLLSAFSYVSASQPGPMDFAFGIPLQVKESGAVFKLQLPREVYQNLYKKDFADIRIFNNENKIVPHSLQRVENKTQKNIKSRKLAFFPVFNYQLKNSNRLSLNINTDSTGAIINLEADEPDQVADTTISFFLIDLTGLDKSPDQLHFQWTDRNKLFSIKTDLSYSNNLTDWYDIKTDTALASLEFSGHTLIKDKIDLPKRSMKYLKMSWSLPSDPKGRNIKQINALFIDKKKKKNADQSYSIAPYYHNPESRILNYKIKGFFPLKRVSIELTGQNKTFKGTLRSKPDDTSEWRVRYHGLFYNIDLDGLKFSNKPVRLGRTQDLYWQLEIESKQASIEQPFPKLKLGWTAHDIYFLNQGQGPFTLAFGNHDVPAPENLVDQLLANFNKKQRAEMIKDVEPGQIFELGGIKTKEQPIPWKQYSLWTILVFGVAILGTMAFRLSKQMNSTQ